MTVIAKTPEQIEMMARAGELLARVLDAVGEAVAPGVALEELDRLAEATLREHGAKSSFKGYHGFPATLCTSLNDAVVHGIPGARELEPGDLLSYDCGLILDGWHADSARTVAVGEPDDEAKQLMAATARALEAGIAQCYPGNHLGDVGAAIQEVVEGTGYSIIPVLVGHGIGRSMHEDPQVPNMGEPGDGPELKEGWVLAVEPMVSAGPDVRLRPDRWTLVTADGSRAAHYEHTVAITAAGPRILTAAPPARR